jgi:hypothetical protein
MAYDQSAARPGSVFSTNPNYAGAWVVYINGLEVPVVGWQVDYGVWEVPSATIHMFPEKVLERLGHEDRVQVAIFYLDHWAGNPEFRLMFDGEIIGWSYANFGNQRTISFDCLAHVHIFQQLYFFFMNTVDNMLAAGDPAVSSTSITQAGFSYPYNLFHQGLIGPPLTTGSDGQPGGQPEAGGPTNAAAEDDGSPSPAAPIQRPFDFVYNIVAGLISDQVPSSRRTAAMVNFFARHVRKTRFYNRWVALPILEDSENVARGEGAFPIFRAARATEALDALQNQAAGRAAGAGPVWNTMQQVLSMVFMEVGMLPTAPCVTAEATTGRVITLLRSTDPLVEQHQDAVDAQNAQDLAAGDNPDFLSFNSTTGQTLSQTLPAVDAELAAGNNEATRAQSQRGIDPTTPVRLAQYFVKPQMYFGIPPMCNVFYPSMIQGYTYSENYIQQPTRVYVNDALLTQALRAQGNNAQFILQALSVGWPEEADRIIRAARGVTPEGGTTTSQGQTRTGKDILLYPEELYKGPVVERMQLPAWFQMLQQLRNSTGGNPAGGSVAGQGATNAPIPAGGPVTSTPPPTGRQLNYSDIIPRRYSSGAWQHGHPTVYAAEKLSLVNPWWYRGHGNSSRMGDALRAMTSIVMNIPPEAILGFAANSSQYDNAGYGDNSHTDIGWLGIDTTNNGIIGGAYSALLQDPTVLQCMRAIGRSDGPVGGTWPHPALDDIEGQLAVGIVNLRNRARGLMSSLVYRPPGARGTSGTSRQAARARQTTPAATTAASTETVRLLNSIDSLWAVAMMFMSWSAGPGNVLRWVGPYAQQLAQVPDRQKWGTFLRLLCEDGVQGRRSHTATTTSSSAHSHNPYYSVVRTLQKIEVARTIAFASNSNRAFFDEGLGADRDRIFDQLTRLAYIVPYSRGLQSIAQAYSGSVSGQAISAAQLRENAPAINTSATIGAPAQITAPPRPAAADPDTTGVSNQNTNPVASAPAVNSTIRVSTVQTGRPADVNQPAQPPSGAPPDTTGPGSRTQDSEVTAPEDGTNGSSQFADLFRNYAQYEFFRARYDKRRAVLNLAFNPYPVPGFPAMIFDKITTEHHAVGYIMHVTQSASAAGSGSMNTTVQLSFCRTLNEFIYNVATDAERFGSTVGSAPAEVIDEIRSAVQDFGNAEDFYNRLLYGGTKSPPNTPEAREAARLRTPQVGASFNFLNALGYAGTRTVDQLQMNGTSVADEVQTRQRITQALAAQNDPEVESPPDVSNEPTEFHVEHNLDPNRRLVPLPNTPYAGAFDNYDQAMKLAARPVCTLAQYIRFWHGGRPIGDLERARLIKRATDDYSYQSTREANIETFQVEGGQASIDRGATTRSTSQYWEYIYQLRQGPGAPPDDTALHYNYSVANSNPNLAQETPGGATSVPGDYPQTRADWQSALQFYRQIVRQRLAPRQ